MTTTITITMTGEPVKIQDILSTLSSCVSDCDEFHSKFLPGDNSGLILKVSAQNETISEIMEMINFFDLDGCESVVTRQKPIAANG